MQEIKHSKFGIASFGCILASGLLWIIYTFFMRKYLFEADLEINTKVLFATTFIAILLIVLVAISFIFGIITLFQKNKKKIFGIIGVILSFVVIIYFSYQTISAFDKIEEHQLEKSFKKEFEVH
ncbi:MAG: hypothetical protein ACK5LP_05340 [Campylobacteraceae bacterium]